MTERPTEQTQGRVTQAEPRPVLPPMPHDETAASNGGPSLSERLQQKLSAVRQNGTSTADPGTNGAAPDQTAVRPAGRAVRGLEPFLAIRRQIRAMRRAPRPTPPAR